MAFNCLEMTASSLTEEIYELIREAKYKQAIKALVPHSVTESKQALSLLAYCYYHSGEHMKAAELYRKLGGEYKLYEAQCFYRGGDFTQSQETLGTLEDGSEESAKLHRALAFESQFASDQSHVESNSSSHVDDIVFRGCMQFRNGNYAAAKLVFTEALGFLGRRRFLLYNLAVCDFNHRDWKSALTYAEEILNASVSKRDQSYIIEALNLKAAVLFALKEDEALSATLDEFPERAESDLDATSLHNIALFRHYLGQQSDDHQTPQAANDVVAKLEFLLRGDMTEKSEESAGSTQAPIPTLRNLLVLLINHEAYDSAADILADFPGALAQEDFDFFEALILAETAPEEGIRRLEQLAMDIKLKIEKHVKSMNAAKGALELKVQHDQYNDILDVYMRSSLALARVFFKTERFGESEKVLATVAEYFSENLSWRTNVGHVLFAQEKFKDAVKFYEMAVNSIREENGNILDVQAVVVANLCVSYVMISENEKAETLIREVEAQEDQVNEADGENVNLFHSTVINLVIGTLYCVKSNWEFGMSRVIKAIDPVEKRLTVDVWEYAKRVVGSFFFVYAKGCLLIKDSVWSEVSEFIDRVLVHSEQGQRDGFKSVYKEARILKLAFLKLRSN